MNTPADTGPPDAATTRPRPLAVDLDGTLIRTDMLFELFWSAMSQSPAKAVWALGGLSGGKAALKARLSEAGQVAPESLPYCPDVMGHLTAHREAGGEAILCTASPQAVADTIAAHLGLFDAVKGSSPVLNLKSDAKADFLVERYGQGGFDYVGDSHADLPVWARASRAIVVAPDAGLARKVRSQGGEVETIVRQPEGLKPYWRAMRPHQWAKNLLVFVPALAAHRLTPEALLQASLAFISFSLVASAIYIINDLLDLAADRAHPRKRMRPLASGALPIAHGTLLSPLLLILGLLAGAATGQPAFLAILLLYIGLTTAYSMWLKRKLIVDIFVLAGLYTIRVLAGAAAVQVVPSIWLIGFSMFIFLSLAAIKRQAELVDGVRSGRARASGRAYYVNDLPMISMIAVTAGYVAVLVFALYMSTLGVQRLYGNPMFLWGVAPILLYWITRMTMMAHRGQMHDDPIVYAVKDRISLICMALMGGLFASAALL